MFRFETKKERKKGRKERKEGFEGKERRGDIRREREREREREGNDTPRAKTLDSPRTSLFMKVLLYVPGGNAS